MIDFTNKKIMIVVAHPDDELLGLGASMNKLIFESNANIHVVILGEGITSRSDQRNRDKFKNELLLHRENIYLAKKKIGYHSISIYDLPDNRFDSLNLLDIIKIVEKEKIIYKPDIVFTHHGGDLNIDHRYVFNSVITAFRPTPNENVRTIICFETPSGTEWKSPSDPFHFVPNFFISLSIENVKAKIAGMECYENEKRLYPHPRSPEALKIMAQQTGIKIGYEYAEAFCIIRSIN